MKLLGTGRLCRVQLVGELKQRCTGMGRTPVRGAFTGPGGMQQQHTNGSARVRGGSGRGLAAAAAAGPT